MNTKTTTNTTRATTKKAKQPSLPTHKLYRVAKAKTEHDKAIWTEIAACWPHKDGNGWSIKFKSNETPLPVAEYVMRRDTRGSLTTSA